MTRQHTYSRGRKVIAALAGVTVFLVSLDVATVELSHVLGTVACGLLGILPSLIPAALQALQAFALDYARSLQCSVQMLVSSWPLLAVIAWAI